MNLQISENLPTVTSVLVAQKKVISHRLSHSKNPCIQLYMCESSTGIPDFSPKQTKMAFSRAFLRIYTDQLSKHFESLKSLDLSHLVQTSSKYFSYSANLLGKLIVKIPDLPDFVRIWSIFWPKSDTHAQRQSTILSKIVGGI